MAWILGTLIGLVVGFGACAWWWFGLRKRQHLAEVAALQTRSAAAEDQAAETARQLESTRTELEAALAETEAVREDLATERARSDRMQSELDTATAGIAELEATITEWATPDDLQRVKGIGPVFEEALAGLGITSYRSVASITDDGAGWIEQALDTFADRIQREEWREQATALHQEKYTGPGIRPGE
jgi:predicted flap endonuclease-1-like 5' DNA nuclease